MQTFGHTSTQKPGKHWIHVLHNRYKGNIPTNYEPERTQFVFAYLLGINLLILYNTFNVAEWYSLGLQWW